MASYMQGVIQQRIQGMKNKKSTNVMSRKRWES
jgi:hypothetical protein